MIVSLGFCGECGSAFPTIISFREYILGWEDGKLVCPKCNVHESVLLYNVSHNLISLTNSWNASLDSSRNASSNYDKPFSAPEKYGKIGLQS